MLMLVLLRAKAEAKAKAETVMITMSFVQLTSFYQLLFSTKVFVC